MIQIQAQTPSEKGEEFLIPIKNTKNINIADPSNPILHVTLRTRSVAFKMVCGSFELIFSNFVKSAASRYPALMRIPMRGTR